MTLVRWSPFEELDTIERRVRRLLGEAGVGPAALPAADVYETDTEFVYEVEVPGFEQDELTVEMSDHTLTIKGVRAGAKEERGKTFRLHERLSRSFERTFELPSETDTERLAAEFERGVLAVHAPKVEEAPSRRIAIGTPS
jgi:HSP20 family protein